MGKKTFDVRDRRTKTLDYWEEYLTSIPSAIECVEMQLLSGRENKPPIFLGPGHIDIKSSTDIEFTMFATPSDDGNALQLLKRAYDNPYEVFDQFCLVATDYKGNEWTCGWTQPILKGMPNVGWPLTGKVNSLATHVSGPWVSTESSVELVFIPKLWLPMNKPMITVTSIDSIEIHRKFDTGEQTIKVLDTEIKFFYKPSKESLWVIARTSEDLQHPYLENWLSEPLRVLLGQLVFPRLVARNFGDGTAQVWLRPSPRQLRDSKIASLVGGNPLLMRDKFWELYENLLTIIAKTKDEKGHPKFEAHPITRFYEELIQATQGSRWVLCMSLASIAEGLAKMLMKPDDKQSDISEQNICRIKDYVRRWSGDERLKELVLDWISKLGQRGIAQFFRDLVKREVINNSSYQAWSDVRNEVMHGNLVSPWATEKEDQKIVALADLVHCLTSELIREGVNMKKDSLEPPNEE